jgi:hypothetical protein
VQKLVNEYGSEFDWESNYVYVKKSNRSHSHSFCKEEYFRSGRDTLRAIALRHKECYKRILLPALCCESMVEPFETNGYEISFFKLKPDLSADFEDILSKMRAGTVFLYINYFGIISLANEKLEYMQRHFCNSILVEDRTHDILVPRSNRFVPDYTVCSIRKWIAIPDGGAIWSSFEEKFQKEKDTYFADVRICALKDKTEYLKSGNAEMKIKFRNEFSEANDYLDNSKIVADISEKSLELIKQIDFEKIYRQRLENVLFLYTYIESTATARNISSYTKQSTLYHPIFVENRDEIQNKLAKKNIYCPVIWPLPKKAIGVCEVSDQVSKHMLAIPCDHRYGATDMEYICDILSEILEDK